MHLPGRGKFEFRKGVGEGRTCLVQGSGGRDWSGWVVKLGVWKSGALRVG